MTMKHPFSNWKKRFIGRWISLLALLTFCSISLYGSEHMEASLIWSIGKADGSGSEFALAPNRYSQFADDGFYVVGSSDPARDWPYVHPGPSDSWAGSKLHTYTILFGIQKAYSKDSCRLTLTFTDTHNNVPPELVISFNGTEYVRQLNPGVGDASIKGNPQLGKPSHISLTVPCSLIKTGTNEVRISTRKGSWLLYDAVSFEGPGSIRTRPVKDYLKLIKAEAGNALYGVGDDLKRDLNIAFQYAGIPMKGTFAIGYSTNKSLDLTQGIHHFSVPIDEVKYNGMLLIEMKVRNQVVDSALISIKPVPRLTVYILPHSHTDIGYTEIQTAIEDKQVGNLVKGIEYARQTEAYPPGARFVWNVEVAWAADLYLNRLDQAAREQFLSGLKNGQIALNGMYLNELSGLCRPEELIRLFRFSTELARMTGQKVDAAMISDVPGYTWGTVTAMAQAGIKYFSVAPNYFDRIGDILVKWENKPFYWSSPSGQEKVLVWIPLKGYAMSHIVGKLTPEWVSDYTAQLSKTHYPYEIAHIRWSGHGDNAVPDPSICEFVRDWNTKYVWPKFIISSTSEAFRAFEKSYGDRLQTVRGDWTPYWEDGAGSSARETGINRNTADRLSQAEALWALQDPLSYPVERFEEAWKKVLLYSEHTWGAWCSITDPENQMTTEQWAIKKSYADEGAKLAEELMTEAMNVKEKGERRKEEGESGKEKGKRKKEKGHGLEVINTTSWSRNDMLFLSKEQSAVGDIVEDASGRQLQSQRMANGELAVTGLEIQPMSSAVISVYPGQADPVGSVTVTGNKLINNLIECTIDPSTGEISSLVDKRNGKELVDRSNGEGLNRYLFFEGNDLAGLQTNGPVTIRIKESGPLIGALEISSDAPGCNSLVRQVYLAHNTDYLVLTNSVDKKRAPMPEKIGDWYLAQNKNKESVNFGFPFNVPEGIMRFDLPLGQMIPWSDQIPSACKNWYSVGRWADVSNRETGITWITLDAPLAEVGELSARLMGSQNNPDVWRKKVKPTQTLYSWVMNNHWGTNYRQYQEGMVTFRYILRPHGVFDPSGTAELATDFSQPLRIRDYSCTVIKPPFTLAGDPVSVITLKPVDRGEGYLVRFFNPGTDKAQFDIKYPGNIWLSNTGEEKLQKAGKDFELAAQEVLTVILE